MALAVIVPVTPRPASPESVLSEIDRHIREGFWDPKLKGVDWGAAVARTSEDVQVADRPAPRAGEEEAVVEAGVRGLAKSGILPRQ